MLINMNGKEYDCKLVKIGKHGKTDDARNLALCEQKANCARCMWNSAFARKHAKKLELREMPKEQLEALKERNTIYPITAETLRCLQPKEDE